jgi:hypothetical protein
VDGRSGAEVLAPSGFTLQSFLFVPHKKGFPLQSLTQRFAEHAT